MRTPPLGGDGSRMFTRACHAGFETDVTHDMIWLSAFRYCI